MQCLVALLLHDKLLRAIFADMFFASRVDDVDCNRPMWSKHTCILHTNTIITFFDAAMHNDS